MALALYLSYAPAPVELARLDLTSVELSFSETVEETAAAVASAPSAPSVPAKAAPPPPPVDAVFRPRHMETGNSISAETLSPNLRDAILPQPAEPIEKVKIEPQREVVRHETRNEKPPQQTAPPQQASAPPQVRVDAPPKPRCAIKPDYPRESRLRGEHGDVFLELAVAADGSVGDVRILKSPGHPLLDEAAVRAARNARFTPANSGGKPVASVVRLTLSFRLK